jgi:hypothetical protein
MFNKKEYKEEIMPNRDGKGPRSRSRYPSRPKGGRKKGKC